jgi:hypothetical protein
MVDYLVVLDNGSTDGTQSILEALQGSGFPLHIVEDPSPGYWQWKRMTRLMREFAVSRYKADWILPLDVDEFVVTNGHDVRDLLGDPREQPRSILWKNYIPHPADRKDEPNPARRICHRLVKEATPREKIIVPDHLAKQRNVIITQGNHAVYVDGDRTKTLPMEGAHIAHIPVRNPGQFGSKIALGYLQYLAMSEREDRWGWHYEIPYRLLRSDPGKFFESFREAALHFAVPVESHFIPETVVDPIPYRGGDLSFTPKMTEEFQTFRAILEYAENLARQYAEQSSRLSSIVEDSHDSGQTDG